MQGSAKAGNDPPPRLCTGKPPSINTSPNSASVHDLRHFDFEKDREESPRGVLDGAEASSKANSSCSDSRSNTSMWHGLFHLWRHKSTRRLSSFPPVGFAKLCKKKTSRKAHENSCEDAGNQFCFFKPSWKNFTISELERATNNFHSENIIGKGGYAEIYKGRLENGQLIAVKRITKGTTDERTLNFLSEMGILVHLHHPNIAKLIGVGAQEGMHLVLELSLHGSLENLLHDSKGKLNWKTRYKIAIGTATGLEYLHERCQRRTIHRDIKVANILLTEDFEPQICDFGLAKWLPDDLSHHTLSDFEGTFGYLAPEYCMDGIVDEKTDVFAYGILLLELITGRKAVDSSQQSLLMWAKPLLEQNNVKGLIDPCIAKSYNSKQANQAVKTAWMCVQHCSSLRPRMSQVLRLLRGEEEGSRAVSSSRVVLQKPYVRRTYSQHISDAEEYVNATSYVDDMSRHKQIAYDF